MQILVLCEIWHAIIPLLVNYDSPNFKLILCVSQVVNFLLELFGSYCTPGIKAKYCYISCYYFSFKCRSLFLHEGS